MMKKNSIHIEKRCSLKRLFFFITSYNKIIVDASLVMIENIEKKKA